ncbi:MAG: hypothetical protein J7559_03385 [Cohnella sp.]|nr:hypothetical protein [Cohnella sp.]
MKRDKWLKWKIGVVASVGVALLFNEVKSSAAFRQASAQPAANDTPAASVQERQPIPNNDELNGGFTRTRHRGPHGQFRQPGQSDSSGQSDFQLQPQTRTGRS